MEQTSVTHCWLLFPLAATALPASQMKRATQLLRRQGWKSFCWLVVPAIYLGLFGEFSIGDGTILPPSLIVVGACMLLFVVFAAIHFRRLGHFSLLFPSAWYLFATCLSGWHSASHLHWIRGVMEVALAFCFLLFPYFFLRNRRQLELCLRVLVLLAVATVLFAVLQAVLFPFVRGVLASLYLREDLWWIVGWGWRGRLAGNWVHPSYLGSVLNVAAPFALLRYVRADTDRRRAIALMLYLTLTGGIALTGTRTPLVACLASSAIFIILARARRRGWAALACATTLVVTLSLFHFRFAPPDVGSTSPLPRSFALAERLELRGSKSVATLGMRWITQGEALSLFRTSPLFGIGMRNYPDRARGDPMAQFSIHNSLVQNLTEAGLFGLTAFLVLMGAALRVDFRPKLSSRPELRPLRAAFFCSSAAILLESLAENSLAVWQILALFWLVRGMSLVVAQRPGAFLSRQSFVGLERHNPTASQSQEKALVSLPVVAG